MTTYGITGATGQLGRKVIDSLSKKVKLEEIIAIARDPIKASDLGIAVRAADYNDFESLVSAFAGIDTLLLISSSSIETRQIEHKNIVEAAQKAGVQRIIYTSLLHADQWGIAFAEDHLTTEKWIKSSGLKFTILRNGWYWENHTSGLMATLDHGGFVGSAGDAKISWATRQDYADAAVQVLIEDKHEGKTYELAGDLSYTLTDLANEVERQIKKDFHYKNLDESEHILFLESVGLPLFVAKMVAEIESRGIPTGALVDKTKTLSALIGRPTTTLQAAVTEAITL
ncbi:SDR family oxidoreductase [Acinetobacter sp. MD2]|uniref:SDR family oxidoreductase n=1 Tax=Acinetobacter sp. MD2 TaxID=2600066 RepID=UPI002D1EDA50|nr:SDR family oxidoreductase [Acinetobacter sp. MD2]MEB3766421.1 SDR family oxidoreductase [Acinetobacter sp. MD2]